MCASTPKKEYRIKIVVAGDGGVGKTSLLNRYISDTFLTAMKMTIGTDFFSKTMEIADSIVKLQLWDFGGEPRFRFLLPGYCKGARGVLLAFDMNDYTTLMNLDEWIQIIRENTKDPILILIGTKADIGDLVDDHLILEFCENNKITRFFPTSAKTGENVDLVFQELVTRILAPVIPIPTPEVPEVEIPTPPPTPPPTPVIPEVEPSPPIPEIPEPPTLPPEVPKVEITPPTPVIPEIPPPHPVIPEPEITPPTPVIPEPAPRTPEVPEVEPPPPTAVIPELEPAPTHEEIEFISEIEFTRELGENKSWKVKLYVLSRGGFGRRALEFLRANSIEFEYVYVDELEENIANELRENLKRKFGRHVSYPFLIVDDKKCLIGFDEDEYRAVFGLY